jgi:hypothetical protein
MAMHLTCNTDSMRTLTVAPCMKSCSAVFVPDGYERLRTLNVAPCMKSCSTVCARRMRQTVDSTTRKEIYSVYAINNINNNTYV